MGHLEMSDIINVTLRFKEMNGEKREASYTFHQRDIREMSLKDIAIFMAYAGLVVDGYLPDMYSHEEPIVEFRNEL